MSEQLNPELKKVLEEVSKPLVELDRKKKEEELNVAYEETEAKKFVEDFVEDYIDEQEIITVDRLRAIIYKYPQLKREINHRIKYAIEASEKKLEKEKRRPKKDVIFDKVTALKKLQEYF